MQNHIENAIKSAVQDCGQSPDLAKKIMAWMQALSVGNETIESGQRATQRVGVIFEATKTATKEP
jgi:hypothetical protein